VEREERQGAEIIRAAFAGLFTLYLHVAPCPGGCWPRGRPAAAAGPRANPLSLPALAVWPRCLCPIFPHGAAAGATLSCGESRRGSGVTGPPPRWGLHPCLRAVSPERLHIQGANARRPLRGQPLAKPWVKPGDLPGGSGEP